MTDFVKRHEIWIFLILAPFLSLGMTYLRNLGFIPGFVYTHGRFYVLMLLLIGIVKFASGNNGLKEVFKPMLNWKINLKWYLFSLFFALTIASVTVFLKEFYLGAGFSMPYKVNFSATTLRNSFFLLTWAFVGEVVWVSYAVRKLSKTTSLFWASQIVGFFWTLWWTPAVYINVGVIIDLPIWALLLNMAGAAGMCAFVYAKTKSGLCVWLLQFMLNMSLIIMPVSPRVGGSETYSLFSVLYFSTMLGFMYFLSSTRKLKVEQNV